MQPANKLFAKDVQHKPYLGLVCNRRRLELNCERILDRVGPGQRRKKSPWAKTSTEKVAKREQSGGMGGLQGIGKETHAKASIYCSVLESALERHGSALQVRRRLGNNIKLEGVLDTSWRRLGTVLATPWNGLFTVLRRLGTVCEATRARVGGVLDALRLTVIFGGGSYRNHPVRFSRDIPKPTEDHSMGSWERLEQLWASHGASL